MSSRRTPERKDSGDYTFTDLAHLVASARTNQGTLEASQGTVQKKYRKVGTAGTKKSAAVKNQGTVGANQGTSFLTWLPRCRANQGTAVANLGTAGASQGTREVP
jgi:hypothetical protein